MGVNEGETSSAPQVLARHGFNKRRFAGAGFADRIDVRKAVFILNPENPLIAPEVDVRKVNGNCLHGTHALFPMSDIWTRRGFVQKDLLHYRMSFHVASEA